MSCARRGRPVCGSLRCGLLGVGLLGAALLVPAPARAEVTTIAGPLPTLRLRLGPAVHLTESEYARGTSLAVDLLLGVPILFVPDGDIGRRGALLYPELGFSYQTTGQYLFNLGLRCGGGMGLLWGSYGVRLVAGDQSKIRAVGVQHGVSLSLYADILSLDVSHQALSVSGSFQHDLIVGFGLNLMQILNLAVYLAGP